MKRVLVVAIDGPAGAGKSSTSRGLAARLGFRHVDTGAMYRVVGVLARDAGIAADDDEGLRRLVDGIVFDEVGDRVVVAGRDLTESIREGDAGEWASKVSTRPVVRERLVALQRRLGEGGRVVMEGRDIGTVVFPDTPHKFFLEASAAKRAERRHRQLAGDGVESDLAEISRQIAERDERDSTRAASPLAAAPDAIRISSDDLDADGAVERLRAEIERRRA